jgi:hypothetical protein
MDEPLPVGLGLRVPLPSTLAIPNPVVIAQSLYSPAPPPVQETPKDLEPGPDGLCDFDDLTLSQVGLFLSNPGGATSDILLSDEELYREVDQFTSFRDFLCFPFYYFI